MKRTAIAAIGCIALLSVAAPAMAQGPGSFQVRAGIFMPTDSATKDAVGKSFFAFGVDYRIGDLNLGNMGNGYTAGYGISVDFQSKDEFRTIPILLNYMGRMDSLFYSVGAGVGINKTPGSDETKFAYQVGVGYDVVKNPGSPPIFVEVKYHGSQMTELNGFAVYVGVRF